MAATDELAIIIPAFNEAGVIGTTLTHLADYLSTQTRSWEIRVVDDESNDPTRDVVEAFARREPRARLQAEPHRGKGGAVRAGMLASKAAYRFVCDADLSMPVQELARFLPSEMAGCDIAIASREAPGARRFDEPWRRHVAGRAFNGLVRQMLLPGIADTQCGFKMFTAHAADEIFPRVTIEGWAFDIEVLYIARLRGLRIREVPIEWHYRRESRLHLLRDGAAMFRELLRIRAQAKRGAYD